MNYPEALTKVDYKVLGKRIKARRIELEMSQDQLAQLSGVSTSFIGHIERGEKRASVETLAALSEVMNMDLNYMIMGISRDDNCTEMKKEIQAILDKYE